MIRKSLIALALVAGLTFPAVAAAKTYTVQSHGVTAQLTPVGTLSRPSPPALTINRGARALYQGTITAHGCGAGCVPAAGPLDPPLRFVPLDGPGSNDLLVNLYSGGANCCSVTRVLRPSAALGGQYVPSAQHNFAYAGYRLQKRGSSYVFITADPTFAFAFTDFADSGQPIQILHLKGVRFQDVTRHYPALVRRDAARWLTAYHKAQRSNNVGLIAAWAADEATLGHWRSAHAYLVSQARAGRLNSTLLPHAASGMRFVSGLQSLLKRDGYIG